VVTASADGTLRVWNLDQGRCSHVLEGHRGPVRSLVLDADRQIVVSAGQDGAVGIWDLVTGSNVRFLRGHRGAVTTVALIGECVAAGGDDGTVRIWRIDDGEALRVIRLANPVQDLVTTADGAAILAAFGSSVGRIEVPKPAAARLPLVLADSTASGELAGREFEFRRFLDVAREHIEEGRMEEAIEPLRQAREVPGYELHQEALALWNRVLAFFPKIAPRSVVELRRFGDGHGVVVACALTPDGSICLAGGGDGSLRLFETATGEETLAIAGHDQGVLAVTTSGDGRWLASAGRDGVVRVWETAGGKIRNDLPGHEGAVQALAFAPDNSVVVSAGDDRTLRVWPLDDSALPELLGSADDAVSAVAVSADGRFVVSGGWDSLVTVWSLPRRAELRRMEGHEGPVHAVAVSPDCRVVASAGEDGTVHLWDLEGGRRWRVLSGHEGAVQAVAFTPDSRFVLSAGKDATLRLWDVRTGTAARVIEGHAGPVTDVVVSRDGGAAVSAGSDASLRLWFLDWEPELPERGHWDDRVRPFLKVFLRRRELAGTAGEIPTWSEDDLRELVEDLGNRGFGWLAPERVEQDLEALARHRDESRTEEQEHTQVLARKRQRQQWVAPARRLFGDLTRNLGLKLAVAAAAVVVILLGVASLRTPQSGEAEFNQRLYRDVSMLVRARGMRLEKGTVLAYQNRSTIGASDCGEDSFVALVDLALYAEKTHSPPLDPGVPAAEERMRVRYSNAVNCIGTLGDLKLVEPILRRARTALHPYRLEDLLGVLVRIGADGDPRLQAALTDKSETARHLAALTLVHGGDPGGIGALRAALAGDELKGVEAASFVLTELICVGAIDDESAFETVRQMCRNIDPRVRRNAVRALVLFENKGPVRGELKDALDDNDPEVAAAAEMVQATLKSAKINELFG
jgi:WD40 repeat protein